MTIAAPIHFFWLFWMGVIALVAIAIVIAIVQGRSGPSQHMVPPSSPMPPSPPSDTPLDILARRFAKGEITAEEYQTGRELLGGGPSS